jgi:hypothetical protein
MKLLLPEGPVIRERADDVPGGQGVRRMALGQGELVTAKVFRMDVVIEVMKRTRGVKLVPEDEDLIPGFQLLVDAELWLKAHRSKPFLAHAQIGVGYL